MQLPHYINPTWIIKHEVVITPLLLVFENLSRKRCY